MRADINPYELSKRLRDLADAFDDSCARHIGTLMSAAEMIEILAEVNAIHTHTQEAEV
jgi:hypothetical protein